MTLIPAVVCVIDDDSSVRKALERLLRAASFSVASYASGQDFLDAYDPAIPGCVILDLEMPELSGLGLQDALIRAGHDPMIVFLTGRAEVPDGVRAMKRGAVEFLVKPVDDDELLAVVRRAIELDRTERSSRAQLGEIRRRIATLTPREAEVFKEVIAGKLNKQIAGKLGTVEKTVKVHRSRVMEKMQVRSLAQLVQLAATANVMPELAKALSGKWS